MKASRYLMQVSLTVQSESKCEIAYLKGSQFCAGNMFPKRDTCNVIIIFTKFLLIAKNIIIKID